MSQARRVGNDVVRRCGRGRGATGRAVVRDALTAAALERIFALGADVLAIEFEALAGKPGRVLGARAGLCRTVPFGRGATVATGLERGAADCLVKPFTVAELTAWIWAALHMWTGSRPFAPRPDR